MPRHKSIKADSMQGLPTREEVDANVKRYIERAISDYDKRRSPAAYWLWPVRMVGAGLRDGAYAFAGVFVELWRRIRG